MLLIFLVFFYVFCVSGLSIFHYPIGFVQRLFPNMTNMTHRKQILTFLEYGVTGECLTKDMWSPLWKSLGSL